MYRTSSHGSEDAVNNFPSNRSTCAKNRRITQLLTELLAILIEPIVRGQPSCAALCSIVTTLRNLQRDITVIRLLLFVFDLYITPREDALHTRPLIPAFCPIRVHELRDSYPIIWLEC